MARKANILIDDNMRMLVSSELGLNEQRRNLNLNQVGFISSLSVRSSGTNPVHYATGNTEHGGISIDRRLGPIAMIRLDHPQCVYIECSDPIWMYA